MIGPCKKWSMHRLIIATISIRVLPLCKLAPMPTEMPAGVVTFLGSGVCTFSALGLRWNPLNVSVLDGGGALHRHPSSWSTGSPRARSLFGGRFSFSCYLLFIFNLFRKRFFSSLYIGLVVFIFIIKRGRKSVLRWKNLESFSIYVS
jgi:hypothetical protein